MAIPSDAALAAELHCLSHNGRFVITAQRWRDPAAPASRPRSWLRLVRNGKVCQDSQFTGARSHRELETFWASRAEQYKPTSLTEDQMWVKLRELAGIEQAHCAGKDCDGRMPVGSQVCPECGRAAHRVAAGSLSWARRRGDIIVPAGVFRAPADTP